MFDWTNPNEYGSLSTRPRSEVRGAPSSPAQGLLRRNDLEVPDEDGSDMPD